VPVVLAVSMTAAGVVYPVTDSALHHTSPIMIATLRALVGGVALTAMLPLMGSRLPRTRRLWLWALAIGIGNTTLTQVGISVGTDRAGAAVAAVLANSAPFFVAVIARFALAETITRLAGGSTDWGRPVLLVQFAYLILGGQVLVYVGFNVALSRWPSTRVYAWTFLVPAVAVVIQAVRGSLPGVAARCPWTRRLASPSRRQAAATRGARLRPPCGAPVAPRLGRRPRGRPRWVSEPGAARPAGSAPGLLAAPSATRQVCGRPGCHGKA
jgi:hypothetical protein